MQLKIYTPSFNLILSTLAYRTAIYYSFVAQADGMDEIRIGAPVRVIAGGLLSPSANEQADTPEEANGSAAKNL